MIVPANIDNINKKCFFISGNYFLSNRVTQEDSHLHNCCCENLKSHQGDTTLQKMYLGQIKNISRPHAAWGLWIDNPYYKHISTNNTFTFHSTFHTDNVHNIHCCSYTTLILDFFCVHTFSLCVVMHSICH